MPGRYKSLYQYLENRYANTVVLTFAQIEDLLGFTLPEQARQHQEWWTDVGTRVAGTHYTDSWILASRTLRPIREAHARQRRFVADASHEMRTPLAAIRAAAESGLEPTATGAGIRAGMASIVASTERLTSITNDLLLLARTDDRTVSMPVERFDLSVTVAEAIATFRLANQGSHLARVNLAPDLRVSGDPANTERIVTNLLDNAFRYGGPAVSVAVTTMIAEGEAVVEVTDDGPGIGPADLGRIFEPFFRVRSDAAGPAGNGLGLAIARSLAERIGGRLTATSQVGSGAAFRLSLPRVR